MTRRLTIIAALLALVAGGSTSTVASAADENDVWFCSSDDITGFFKKDGRWKSGFFVASKLKVKFGKTIGGSTSITVASGTVKYEYSCKADSLRAHIKYCLDDNGGYFSINRKTGNYVSAESHGWLNNTGTDKRRDSVTIERGTCTKF